MGEVGYINVRIVVLILVVFASSTVNSENSFYKNTLLTEPPAVNTRSIELTSGSN